MSVAVAPPYNTAPAHILQPLANPALASQALRPTTAPFMMLPAVALTGIGYLSGGTAHLLTNCGFLWMALCCIAFVILELKHLRTRQGWGALTIFGGVLVWFCMDYFKHWWDPNWALFPTGIEQVIAKMAFLHTTFVALMAFGLTLRVPDRAIRWIEHYPEPKSLEFLFWFAVFTLAANWVYIYFFSWDPFFTTIYKAFFGGRLGQSGYKVGVSGNLNYSILGYISFLAGYVSIGSIAAMAYITMAPPAPVKKSLALGIWMYALMVGFGGGTRTALLAVVLPGLLFILLRGIRHGTLKKSLLWIAIIGITTMAMVQFQTFFRSDRGTGLDFQRMDFSDERLTSDVQGNTMFSEALDAYFEIPEHRPFFHNDYPGEGAIRAIPQMLFWFGIGPIPRPLWKDKPVDPAWAYRAEDRAGTGEANQGTTASYGLVGAWYFRFGWAGVIEGAIVMGWLYAMTERLLRTAFMQQSFMRMIIGLFMLSTLFFFFRDIVFFGVWQIITLFVATYFVLKIFNLGKSR